MNYSKTLFIVLSLTFAMAVGCVGKKRIEGVEVPTQPQPSEVIVAQPTVAPPPQIAEVPPPPPAEPTAEPTPAPTEEPVAEATPEPPPAPETNPCGKYIVVKGDTLWDISGGGSGYHDNFQWPLIFKANRDQIVDPDLIYPKQEFCIRQDFSEADIKKARQNASDTPLYIPHHKPREVLPLDYF
jgi:hypothetical protein